MTWQTPLFILVAGFAFGYSGKKFSTLIRMMKAHKNESKGRLNELGKRTILLFTHVLGQKAVLKKPIVGLMHATIFWGFLIITIGTLEQFASTIYAPANFTFIGETFYRLFVRINDYFVTAVLLAIGVAAYRRYFMRPPGLGKSKDANIVLLLTSCLMVSILFMNAFHILGEHPPYANSMPVSNLLAALLTNMQLSPDLYNASSTFFKWVHMCIVLGFAMYIPSSKHLHIVAAGPNTFMMNLKREKGMTPINFEDEKVTQYGAAKVTDLGWKDALDYYSCTECGRCQDLCPAWNTQKPLSPKRLVLDLKDNMYRNKEKILSGKLDEVSHVIDEKVTEDVIWACTTCRACEVACPVFIEQVDKIYDIRRNLVLMESKFPAEVQSVFKNMETNATPWAFSSADRANWAEGLQVKTMAEADVKGIDILLWVGCAGSYDDRNKKVLRAFVSILKKANVNFAILGKEEQCTGDPARRIGNEYLYQTLAKANVETLNRYNVKKIVTACPHCFNTIKNEYKDFGGTYEVFHHSQFIAQLIHDGKIKPTQTMNQKVTFHDSCYMGRWNNVYEQPRSVLGSVPGIQLTEMKNNHDMSMCCGAGGGRMWMEEKIGKRVNIARTEQALETGSQVIASSCPFCMTMMNDGVKAKEAQGSVKVMDLAEIIDQST
jgi:Fe-S oxidoreductase